MDKRPKVGEILLRAGLVDEFQLRAALGEQKRWGSRLGATLIKLGFVEEKDLIRALASQLNLPVATLDGKRIHPDVLALVPAAVAEKQMVIPLFVKREAGVTVLYLGTDDPGNLEVFDDLAFRTGLAVRPVMVAPSEICEGIDRYYTRSSGEAAAPEPQPAEPTPIAAPREIDLDAESTAPVLRGALGARAGGTDELVKHWSLPGPVEDETVPDHAPSPAAPEVVAAPLPSAPIPLAPAARAVAANSAAARGSEPSAFESKTRVLLQALAQLLVDKGVMTREEFHQRVRDLQLGADGGSGAPLA